VTRGDWFWRPHVGSERLAHQRNLSTISALTQDLIRHYAKQNHGAHHRKVERTRNAQQVNQIAQYLKQRRANQNSHH
jgi:hypothetical protein